MHLCPKLLCAKVSAPNRFFCASDFSLTVRDFWRAEQLRWVETNFEQMRQVDQCSDEMKTVEKNLLRSHVRRDVMRWEELRWDEVRRAHVIWVEMKCRVRKVQVWSAKCGVWSVHCEVWGKFSIGVALRRGSRAGHVLGQQHRNNFAQSTRARAWLAHGACKFYRWESSYSTP